MKIINCEQRSEEWYKCRLGIPSSSSFDKIITNNGAPSKQADDYALELAMERITGHAEDSFQSQAMKTGIEREDNARLEYEVENGCIVEQVGFCIHDSGMFGNSPDGLMQNISKGMEIKCPKSKTFARYKMNPAQAVSDYKQQLQGSMLVSGYPTWDLVVYYPGADLLIIEVKRDEEYCNALFQQLYKFNKELDRIEQQLRSR